MKKSERRMMTTAMAELIFADSDYLEQGVPPGKLLKAMSANTTYTRKDLEDIILQELEIGGLVKMDNGNYTLGAGGNHDEESIETDSYNGSSSKYKVLSSTSSPLRVKGKPGRKKGSTGKVMTSQAFIRNDVKKLMGIRVGERHKRAKKVFDPSDINPPIKKKRGRPLGTFKNTKKIIEQANANRSKGKIESGGEGEMSSDGEDKELSGFREGKGVIITGGVCSVCRQHKNARDTSGKLVSCRDCSNKAHYSCLRGDGMLRIRPDNTWQCPHCKTCVVCIETNDAGLLTVCSVCADAYHTLCHTPPIPEKLKAWDQWECRNCLETKNSHPSLDTSYIEKMPSGSEHSSKNSDRSDSRKSSVDRKRDKSSGKSIESEDKNDKLIIADKDDRSFTPTSLDNSEWKHSTRKLISPNGKNTCYDWKYNRRKSLDSDERRSLSQNNEMRQNKPSKPSIYMDNFENNKWHTVATYQKHPNERNRGGAGAEDDVDPSIPNAENWSNVDVYKYFSSYFPEEAEIFKDQEIDGRSLLLMRRNDLIHSFGLPLGPALKIYRHVVKLQTRRDDFSMCWV